MAAVDAVGFCAVGCYRLGGKRLVLVGVLRVCLVGMKEDGGGAVIIYFSFVSKGTYRFCGQRGDDVVH